MKETYNHEFNKIQKFFQRTLGIQRINRDSFDFSWGYFCPRWGLEFIVNRGGYFDNQYSITFCFIWGRFNIKLPFRTRLEEGCDLPRYGFQFFEDLFWIHCGGYYDKSIGQVQDSKARISFYLPFKSWKHDGTWILNNNKEWYKLKKGELSYQMKENGTSYAEVHDYTYTLKNGEVQHRKATCTVEKRKWHRKWFPMFTREHISLDVEFDLEVGEGIGSWKGGTVGCGYDMLKGETIEQCLRRMEKERTFK